MFILGQGSVHRAFIIGKYPSASLSLLDARDAKTRRASQQQRANVNAAAEAAALRAMQEESTRLVGEHKSGRVTSNFYLAKIRDCNFQCLCVKRTSRNCCAIQKIRDYYFGCLFVMCTCDVILSTKVFTIFGVCSRRKNNISISQGLKCINFSFARPLFYAPIKLCLGFIAANAAAKEAARMAARVRRARQLVGKELFRCYQCILLLYSLYTSAGRS